jgi:hypothetical protein
VPVHHSIGQPPPCLRIGCRRPILTKWHHSIRSLTRVMPPSPRSPKQLQKHHCDRCHRALKGVAHTNPTEPSVVSSVVIAPSPAPPTVDANNPQPFFFEPSSVTLLHLCSSNKQHHSLPPHSRPQQTEQTTTTSNATIAPRLAKLWPLDFHPHQLMSVDVCSRVRLWLISSRLIFDRSSSPEFRGPRLERLSCTSLFNTDRSVTSS